MAGVYETFLKARLARFGGAGFSAFMGGEHAVARWEMGHAIRSE